MSAPRFMVAGPPRGLIGPRVPFRLMIYPRSAVAVGAVPSIAIAMTPAVFDRLHSFATTLINADEIWLCDGRQSTRRLGQEQASDNGRCCELGQSLGINHFSSLSVSMLAAEQESRIDLDQFRSMATGSHCPSRRLTNDEERRISELLDELKKDRTRPVAARPRFVTKAQLTAASRRILNYITQHIRAIGKVPSCQTSLEQSPAAAATEIVALCTSSPTGVIAYSGSCLPCMRLWAASPARHS